MKMSREELSARIEQMRKDEGYCEETFVSPGYGFHDDLLDVIEAHYKEIDHAYESVIRERDTLAMSHASGKEALCTAVKERDEARAEVKIFKDLRNDAHKASIQLEKERDEAREELRLWAKEQPDFLANEVRLKNERDEYLGRCETLIRERDETRTILKTQKDMLVIQSEHIIAERTKSAKLEQELLELKAAVKHKYVGLALDLADTPTGSTTSKANLETVNNPSTTWVGSGQVSNDTGNDLSIIVSGKCSPTEALPFSCINCGAPSPKSCCNKCAPTESIETFYCARHGTTLGKTCALCPEGGK